MKTKLKILSYILVLLFVNHLNGIYAQETETGNTLSFRKAEKQTIRQNIIRDGPTANKFTVSNGNWNTGSVWNGGTVPATGDNILIQNNVTLNSLNITVGTLTINSGSTLTLNSQSVLWINSSTSISGTIIMNSGTAVNNTWLIPLGDFLVNSGGIFTATGANIRFDFAGTANQTFTNNGTITAPLVDLSTENPVSLTIAGSNPIISSRVNLFSGIMINSNLITIGNSLTDVFIQRGVNGNTKPAGIFDQKPNFNAGAHLTYLIYDYSTTPINAGIEFPSSNTVSNFQLYDAPTVILNSDITVTSDLTFFGSNPVKFTGTFDLGGKILTLGATFTRTGSTGILKGGGNSSIVSNGTTATTLPTVTNGGLFNLTINNTGGVTLNGDITVSGALGLYAGTLTNTVNNNITMSTGSIIVRSAGRISIVPAGTSYDVRYTNSAAVTSGPELQNNTVIRDLDISGSNSMTLSANATVNRNIIFTSGNLSISSFTLTLNGGSSIVSGTLTGGATSRLTAGGTGNINLPDVISGKLNTFTVNRTTNDVITLGGNLEVTSALTFTNGNISTGTFVLSLSNSVTTALTRVKGYIYGIFARAVSAAGSYLFPLGNSSLGRMVTVNYTTAPSVAGTLTTQFISGDAGNYLTPLDDSGYLLDTYSKVGYWEIDQSASLGGIYTLSLNGEGFFGVFNYPLLRILKRASSPPNSPWYIDGTHIAGTGSNANPVANRSGMSGFSQFIIAGNATDNILDGALPVELLSFTSALSGNSAVLKWVTASEKNNKGFEIHRKDINTDWQKIGFVAGNGTSNTQKTYTFTDNNLGTNSYNYRLKQIDYNGNFEYFELSTPVTISVPSKFDMKQNYPNPFNPSTTIQYSIPNDAFVNLKIYDITGRELANLVNTQVKAGSYSVNFNADTYQLASGTYFYKITAGKYINVKKLILIR
jgi:hypothetical protein